MAKDRKPAVRTSAVIERRPAPITRVPNPEEGIEHRGFPRRHMELAIGLIRGERNTPTFSASLRSDNVSMSGMFVRSTFFLPVGTIFDASFNLPGEGAPVRVRAELVRHQDAPVSGFGLRFVEFFGQTEVALARLFLEERLRNFVDAYLESDRAQTFKDPAQRLVDAIAGWELSKVTTGEDPWAG